MQLLFIVPCLSKSFLSRALDGLINNGTRKYKFYFTQPYNSLAIAKAVIFLQAKRNMFHPSNMPSPSPTQKIDVIFSFRDKLVAYGKVTRYVGSETSTEWG